MGFAAAQEPVSWPQTPDEATDLCRDAIRRAEAALQAVAVIPEESRSFANTPEALETALQDLEDAAAPAVLLRYVAVSSATRDAAAQCEAKLNAFAQGVLARADLYRALNGYAGRRENLSGEKRLLLERELADFKYYGAALDRDARLELRFLRERLAALEQIFADNIEWPRASLLFAPEELAGLPEAVLQALPRQSRLFRVQADSGDYRLFLASVKDPSARRRLEFVYHNRAAVANEPVLREILALRRRVAKVLGSQSYARLELGRRLVNDPGRVRAILRGLHGRLQAPAREELAALVQLKMQDAGVPGDRTLHSWDRDFYLERMRKDFHPRGEDAALAQYFPISAVVEGALAVLQRVFSLRLRRLRDAALWHPDAVLYEASDAAGGEVLGYFYLDLLARPGKPQRPAVFLLTPGRFSPEAPSRPAVCALLAGFARPPQGREALLRHGVASDVEDLFHGMGHVLELVLARSRYARFSGANLSPDLVEAPAFLLGHLAWRPEVAAVVSGHWQDRARRLPPELLREAAAARGAGSALGALDAAASAWAGLELNSGDGSGPGAAYRRAFARFAVEPATEGTHPEAADAALARGDFGATDGIVARLLAEELWQRWSEEGLFNPAACRHLRETFLTAGAGSEARSLRNYLGREPDFRAVSEPVSRPVISGESLPQEISGPPWRRRLVY